MREPLDIENVDSLREYVASRPDGARGIAAFRVLPGGVSSRTVWVALSDGDKWVLKQALPKLRVAMDWYSDPRRVHREALGLRCLETILPRGSVPGFVFEDHERHLLAMRAVPEPHENWKSMLLAGRIDADHARQFAEMLGRIHAGAAERRAELEPLFADRSYFESLRIEPYYACVAAREPGATRFLSELVSETRASRLTLVHGDYSPKNILVHEGRLVLLDHEVMHWGDPAFDVGFALTHLLSKAHHRCSDRELLLSTASAFWRDYARAIERMAWSASLERRAARHTVGCLLARVAGRSPLEYLDCAERSRQRDVSLAWMAEPPSTVERLIGDWREALLRDR
ncbi:MAG: hypothetical protein FJ297_12355 [Planctomycetes bacterium]|nr:hypothetical protein [Planctomycetota bacterium]